MKPIILLSLLLISICYIPGPIPSSIKWKLEIKNEYGNEDLIVLKPGRYTKITLLLSPEDGHSYLDYSNDKSKFKIYLQDENIVTKDDDLELEPSKSLEYSTYIGLNCQNSITEDIYPIQFNLKNEEEEKRDENPRGDGEFPILPIDDSDEYETESNLNIQTFNVTIDRTPKKIKLIPLKTSLPEKSYSIFKLEEELYNINEIKIGKKNKDEKNNYVFTTVKIPEFDPDDEFRDEKTFSNGILLDYHYAIQSTYEKLGNETSFIFELELLENITNCFALDEDSQNLKISAINDTVPSLNDATKQAIIYSIENVTPKKDETNNIQLKMNIPFAPVTLSCDIKPLNEDSDSIEYKDFISESGEQILKFDNLMMNKEYFIKCKFESTDYNKQSRTSFEILIGNNQNFDVITQLTTSKDINRTPQCAQFTFGENSNTTSLANFESLAEKYCYQVMNEEESILSRIMQSVICQSVEIDDDDDEDDNDDYDDDDRKEEQGQGQGPEQDQEQGKEQEEKIKKVDRKFMICTGPSNQNYNKRFNGNEKKINFNENFDKFVDNLSTQAKINETLGLNGLELESIKRYYDNEAPDTSKIEVVKEKGIIQDKDNKKLLKFNITSTNSQPIECFYNEELNSNYNKRYIKLDIKDVVLNEGETKDIEIKIMDNPIDGTILSVYMICYNLPGFDIRYESTGVFTAYTYYYSQSGEEDQEKDEPQKSNVTIDCKDERNRKHPYCLKDRATPIINEMKTKMPDFIENMMEQSEQFEKLPSSSKEKFLEQSKKDLESSLNKMDKNEQKDNRVELVEKSTELAEYLNKRDCSLYENSNEYKECRERKKDITSELIKVIEKHFQCEKIVSIIKEGLTDDVEQNLKYILFLISEITNNADALNEGNSEVLYNITLCLQENFEDYWENVENSLVNDKLYLNTTIKAVKKDISFILLKSLTNLINILHYDEIDGYAKNAMSKTGIMENSEGKKIQKGIFDFIKQFNDFGNGTYNISDIMNISVTVIDKDEEEETSQTRLLLEEPENKNNQESDEQTHNISDKGIYVILHPKKMMKRKGGQAMQFVVFDSPLIPLEREDDDNSTVRDFISITVFDKNGKEVNITDLPEEERPVVLYNKTHHKKLKHCFYYNETKEELDTDGVEAKDDFEYKGKKYFKCSSKHLTSFTAGDYISEEESSSENKKKSNWWKVLLIILAVLIVIVLVAFLIIHFRKNKVDSKTIEKSFSGQDGIMNPV